ncbi:DUF5786 family protein [Halobacteriaceae archaeon GCM10025711]
MSMGAYDEEEHERRERKTSEVDIGDDDTRTIYEGTVEYDSGESAEQLLDQFRKIKSS